MVTACLTGSAEPTSAAAAVAPRKLPIYSLKSTVDDTFCMSELDSRAEVNTFPVYPEVPMSSEPPPPVG